VASYAGKGCTLWELLLLLPFGGLVTGAAALLRVWNRRVEPSRGAMLAMVSAPVATLFIGWATITSAVILAIVVLQMAANWPAARSSGRGFTRAALGLALVAEAADRVQRVCNGFPETGARCTTTSMLT